MLLCRYTAPFYDVVSSPSTFSLGEHDVMQFSKKLCSRVYRQLSVDAKRSLAQQPGCNRLPSFASSSRQLEDLDKKMLPLCADPNANTKQ